ncbi:MAG: c-type cytochrome [Casimicrobium sp.]
MKTIFSTARTIAFTSATLAILSATTAFAQSGVDTASAEALIKSSKCLKCHSVDKKKDGPAFKETAAKYKGKADAEATLFKHITTAPKIKVDGVEEEHQKVLSKNESEIRNLVRWILTR